MPAAAKGRDGVVALVVMMVMWRAGKAGPLAGDTAG